MKDINVASSIIPLGTFKAQAARLLRELIDSDEPLVITQNGRPAAVVLAPAAFEKIRKQQRYLEAVAQGIADGEAGRLVESKTVESWLQSWGKKNEKEPPQCR